MKSGKLPMALLGDAFFLQGYAPHILEHGWSLAVEEHFYFVLPMVLLAMMRLSKHQANPFRCVPLISICLTMVCLYLQIHASRQGATWFAATHLRVDAPLLRRDARLLPTFRSIVSARIQTVTHCCWDWFFCSRLFCLQ